MMNDSNERRFIMSKDQVEEFEDFELEEMTDVEDTDDEATEAEGDDEVTFSAKEIASELGLTAKDFRRWLRSKTDRRANKGGRWVFTADEKADWIKAYNTKDEAAVEADAES